MTTDGGGDGDGDGKSEVMQVWMTLTGSGGPQDLGPRVFAHASQDELRASLGVDTNYLEMRARDRLIEVLFGLV